MEGQRERECIDRRRAVQRGYWWPPSRPSSVLSYWGIYQQCSAPMNILAAAEGGGFVMTCHLLLVPLHLHVLFAHSLLPSSFPLCNCCPHLNWKCLTASLVKQQYDSSRLFQTVRRASKAGWLWRRRDRRWSGLVVIRWLQPGLKFLKTSV